MAKKSQKKLYYITTGVGEYYVVASNPLQAEKKLTEALELSDIGFDKDREAKEIKLLAKQIVPGLKQKYFFASGDTLLL